MTIPATTRVALTDFLLERIAEDEDVARRAAFGYGAGWTSVSDDVDDWSAVHADGKRDMVGCEDRDVTRHIARHDPAHVLAECAAKRRVVGMFQVAQVIQNCKSYPGEESAVRLMVDALEGVVRVHATAYADHPDYQPNWRPTP